MQNECQYIFFIFQLVGLLFIVKRLTLAFNLFEFRTFSSSQPESYAAC